MTESTDRRSLASTARQTLHQAATAARRRKLLAASGIVDVEWVELIGELEVGAVDGAARRLVGASKLGSPHPLFEADWLRGAAQEGPWEAAGVDPFTWYLQDERARRNRSPHPLISLPRIRQTVPGAAQHPLGPFAAWASTATPESIVPTPDGYPEVTWGALRASILQATRDYMADADVNRVRRIVSSLPPNEDHDLPTAELAQHADGPLVSIIMPTWNRGARLREAVRSVQEQTFGGWELLIVDDGSDDDTEQVVRGLAAYDDRIVYLPREHSGVCKARNAGIAAARGRYVAFLDSDNTWVPEFLHHMLSSLEQHEWPMAHAAIRLRRPHDADAYRALEGSYEHLLVANHIDLNVLVVRADALRAIGGFDEDLRRAVDYDLVLRLAQSHQPHLLPFVGADYDDSEGDAQRISNSEPASWISVVLSKYLVDWESAAEQPRSAGLTSIVVPMRYALPRAIRWMRAIIASDADAEVILVGTRLRRSAHSMLSGIASLTGGRARLEIVSSHISTSLAMDIGISRAAGERVVCIATSVKPDVDDAVRLAGRLDDERVGLVQPVVTAGNGTVLSAGAMFGPRGTRPRPLLAGHAVRDTAVGEPVTLPAALSPIFAARVGDLVALHGIDPLFEGHFGLVDLSLRLRERGLTAIVDPTVVSETGRPALFDDADYLTGAPVLERRWPTAPAGTREALAAFGFDVAAYRNHRVGAKRPPRPLDNPLLVPAPVLTPIRIQEGAPRLRWTIDTAAPPGPEAESWGDVHFARSLAAALERLGQHVAVDSRLIRHRPTRDLDDVVLVLRGLDRVHARPGPLNLMWIISHPDMVTPAEAAEFDQVFAASTAWSTATSKHWGLSIQPLLQCTDPALFGPDRYDAEVASDVLFVGNSRDVFRSSLRAALAAEADVTVYGDGWATMLGDHPVAATYVDNARLGALYGSAGIVLNDHWEDMRRDGFLSNRLFDAAASGTCIISDDVPGLADVFGDQVQVFRDDADMARLLSERATSFPDAEARRALADNIRTHHSFDARAAELVQVAARLALGE